MLHPKPPARPCPDPIDAESIPSGTAAKRGRSASPQGVIAKHQAVDRGRQVEPKPNEVIRQPSLHSDDRTPSARHWRDKSVSVDLEPESDSGEVKLEQTDVPQGLAGHVSSVSSEKYMTCLI